MKWKDSEAHTLSSAPAMQCMQTSMHKNSKKLLHDGNLFYSISVTASLVNNNLSIDFIN